MVGEEYTIIAILLYELNLLRTRSLESSSVSSVAAVNCWQDSLASEGFSRLRQTQQFLFRGRLRVGVRVRVSRGAQARVKAN